MGSHKIPLLIKTGWAIGELATAFYIGVSMAFFMYYLTEGLLVSASYAGLALFIPRIWDAVTDPLMGIISDKTHSSMGRRRPYVLLGSILFGLSFWLVFTPPDGLTELGYVLYFSFMYALVGTAFTIFDIPYSAMAAEMTADYKERTNLVGFKMMGARIGIILAAWVTPQILALKKPVIAGFELVGIYGAGVRPGIILSAWSTPLAIKESVTAGFDLVGIYGGIFITICGLIAFISTKDANRTQPDKQPLSLKNIRPLKEMVALANNKYFSRLFVIFLLQNIAIGSGAATLVYFVAVSLKQDISVMGPLFTLAGVMALISTPIWVYIGARIGKKTSYLRAMSINAIIVFLAFFLSDKYFFLIYGLYLVMGFADAGNQLMSNSMVPDTVEYDQLLTGKRREGVIFGAWAFCRKFGMALGALIASQIMGLFGFISGSPTQTVAATLSIRIAYAIFPALLWLGAIYLLKQYQLDEKVFGEIQQKIKAED